MKFAELIRPWIKGEIPDCEILGLHNDSRQIKPGFLFFAYPGAATDGRLFIAQALEAGASALIYEPENWSAASQLPSEIPSVALPGLADKLAEIAERFYREPTKKLVVSGVTGTNGKTTIAYQLAQAHALLGERSAYIGTIGQGEVSALQTLANTTPDALCLQELMYSYEQQAIKQVCMEVSSHALCQHRVDNIDFQQAIFTNLSHEHLDYHQTMEAYAAAKAKLFAKPTLKWSIVNHDDKCSALMRAAVQSGQIISYGIQEGADVRALRWEVSLAGTQLEIASPWGQYQMRIKALGFFNIYNALAVFSSLVAYGYPVEQVVSVMAKLQAAPGRMEIVAQEPYAIVDYAHSPDALENVLATLQKVKKGKILVVFGCGGDRDRTKRPIMGKIASQYADIAIITSDNPRTEDPLAIIDAIEAGISVKNNLYKIPDREQAIAKALSLADKDDIVLVAGKGHEDYQQIGKTRHSFSDQAVIRRIMN
ncbi:UDP-N-acetylmuramoyl-L-alanyl-D-glutamate--2, 6-diaminopimelate ligase [Legionella massiliensis]|uniref:UDP-N-acetylmuramoyl-L-alanyl-D-glutamate--2,6-diaminopimelate ligase n=1 Tax=Legionella massiliensis TaxID=1034943 RepID=A0A078L3D2_9GAMM|nr:UDP-N-acetylmuramoyl-L-alanyl-D-glutamate--2,6-diaminopimelate ligase [Legionella massiliensis]CDZ78629.1 UDP-N-acetylmuramoyl-L-alanyl-D-glutamate--2, 6-diaminopimelate ligase [Legionella massiliensis]CEE14367.1 UDP-N-acetylmuramoyl-L-alanyl-D-glutamate--2, 6-diaminopimelate ligase [Legionella massiliensis]